MVVTSIHRLHGQVAQTAFPHYDYSDLPDPHSSIRIFILRPGEQGDQLEGGLTVVDSATFCDYEPLSYVWGDPQRVMDLVMYDDHHSRRSLKLTESLANALRRLRYRDRERSIWADQLCINQDNIEERSQQVQFMTRIYRNAAHVLVWLGLDDQKIATSALKLVQELDDIFQDECKSMQFRTDYTRNLGKQCRSRWKCLVHLIERPWFTRGWIVQEIGFQSKATLLWGEADFEWAMLHRVTERLHDYQLLRNHFNLRTGIIRYAFERFIEPSRSSYHANRFSFIYELHRARALQVTDPRDRVFSMLGHFSVRSSTEQLANFRADYSKSIAQVYNDVALRALRIPAAWHEQVDDVRALAGRSDYDFDLITLSAVQHTRLPSSLSKRGRENDTSDLPSTKNTLPTWVPDWQTYLGFMLSEPIQPRRAQGYSLPRLSIEEERMILKIHGVRLDVIESCSLPLKHMDLQQKCLPGEAEIPIQRLWREATQKKSFDSPKEYRNGDSALFAFMQTLSNGCIQNAAREGRAYHDISKATWEAHQAAFLIESVGQVESLPLLLHELAKTDEAKDGYQKWGRVANAASQNRIFATTKGGYFALGPKVMEAGDILCVFWGAKMPFCLRPLNGYFLLVGECYVHGLMHGEAVDLWKSGKVCEEAFEIV